MNTILKEQEFSTYFHYNVLLKHGYKITKIYKKLCDQPQCVCLVKDTNDKYYVAKSHLELEPEIYNSWERMKEIYKNLENLGVGPKIYEFIEPENICIMECGYKTLEEVMCSSQKDIENMDLINDVKMRINILHTNYIHGDLHCGNIMVRKDRTSFFIDLDTVKNVDVDNVSCILNLTAQCSTIDKYMKFEKETFMY
jgi:tRNA A-37 threonylcarbamoyl transferase component Bud32